MAGLEGSYAVIGGIACKILLNEADLSFRATPDFDTVLVADDRLPGTARAIWSLVRDGGYRCGWGRSENVCFYRFTEPKDRVFPSMIELFSKTPDYLSQADGLEVAPLHVDDEASSLSAILLDDDYYKVFLGGIRTVEGVSVLDAPGIIPFKAKAHLDLKERREQAGNVDSSDVRKHKKDVFRLAQLLTGNENIALPEAVAQDMQEFLDACRNAPVNLKQIGINGLSMEAMIETIEKTYGIAPAQGFKLQA